MLSVKLAVVELQSIFSGKKLLLKLLGLCNKELLLGVENRNHVWRDLSRLVDTEWPVVDSKGFSGKKLW